MEQIRMEQKKKNEQVQGNSKKNINKFQVGEESVNTFYFSEVTQIIFTN